MMIAAFDAHYRADGQVSAAAVLFQEYVDSPILKAFSGLQPVPE
jgi:deoxyinosine 3'endonuclease (endonuclease V)